MSPDPRLSRRTLLGGVALAGLVAGCAPSASSTTISIGYFPNVTHAPGLIADQAGFLGKRLGELQLTAATKSFRAGPEVLQAILSGSLDVCYVGPSPTITAYVRSRNQAVRVVAGATSGGASLVVVPRIRSVNDLRGARLASPQLGNTQDVALRYWLKTQGLNATTDGGGDVSIIPQANSAAVQAFKTGGIDGGWLPEPYATGLVRAGGVVLVDERYLWPRREFITTNLIARTEIIQRRPEAVSAVLNAHLDALDLIEADASAAQASVAAQLTKITGQNIDRATLATAWTKLAFGPDPLASTLRATAEHADAVGLLPAKPTDSLTQMWSLDLVNQALTARGKRPVTA